MAFLFFSTRDGKVELTNSWDTDPAFEADELAPGDYCVQYDFDPDTEEYGSLVLNDAKDTVVNRFPGKTKEEQRALLAAEAQQRRVDDLKAAKVARIKSYVTDAIEDLDWRAERAEELDFMEGPNVTTRQAKVAAYRKAARDANNAREAELLALTELEDIEAFDTNWVPAFKEANTIDF